MFKLANLKKIKNYLPLILFFCFAMYLSAHAITNPYPNLPAKWKLLMDEYRMVLAYIAGFGALTSILVFIIHFIELGSLPAHPIKRREKLMSMLVSGVCTALLGGMTLILTLFYAIIFM